MKELRKVIGVVVCFVALIAFRMEPSMTALLVAAAALFIGRGIDYLRDEKAKTRLRNYLSINDFNDETIHVILDSYLDEVGRGHLAITDRWVLFIQRKGDIYLLSSLHNVIDYGYEYIGSGIFTTRHSQSSFIKGSLTREEKYPIVYIGVNQDGETRIYQFFTKKQKKTYKTLSNLIENGVVSREKQKAFKERNDAEERLEMENRAIVESMDLIMDRELNELDNSNTYFLQNLGTYADALFDVLSDQFPKLLSLQEDEKEDMEEYLMGCAVRGHRLGRSVINTYTTSINENNLVGMIIPSELAQEKLDEVVIPDYPAIQTIIYSQYKYFRHLNLTLFKENEILSLTKEYIRIGAKNTMANYLAINEL